MNAFFHLLRTGFAIFSMFFGSGNLIYPLAVGYQAGDQNAVATLGFLLTAVMIPFCGLISIVLYNGNTRAFFGRLGTFPGLVMSGLILALLGPFGVVPRCIAVAYATLQNSIPGLSLEIFSAIACLIVFVCAWRKQRMITVLGACLTPMLLVALVTIIAAGIWNAPAAHVVVDPSWRVFISGVTEGYYTMDLLAAFFFCSLVIKGIREESEHLDNRTVAIKTLKAGLVGMGILSLIYVGFSTIAAQHAESLGAIAPADLLGAIATKTLGSSAGLVAALAIALACLTTAIALSSVFAQALHEEISQGALSYPVALTITLGITFAISLLGLSGIMAFLGPILQACYPVLIAVTFVNIGLWYRERRLA